MGKLFGMGKKEGAFQLSQENFQKAGFTYKLTQDVVEMGI